MSTESDKVISNLYLARSEGKIIQYVDAQGEWFDLDQFDLLKTAHRVKPQTLQEAIDNHLNESIDVTPAVTKYFTSGAVFGVVWQKEQDK